MEQCGGADAFGLALQRDKAGDLGAFEFLSGGENDG